MSDWYHAQLSARERYAGLSEHAATEYQRKMRSTRNKQSLIARISSAPGAVASAINVPSLSVPAQAVRQYWWVPAGFATLVLLRVILGG